MGCAASTYEYDGAILSAFNESCLCLTQGPDPKPKLRGDARTFRVWLDPNQYQQDMTNNIQTGAEDPYETFNIIMRRKPKENNFKVSHFILVQSSLFSEITHC